MFGTADTHRARLLADDATTGAGTAAVWALFSISARRSLSLNRVAWTHHAGSG
jgi:hypothetical protein